MRLLAVLVCVSLLSGCGEPGSLGLATTPEASQALLNAGLEAWKKGVSQKELAQQSPPIYFVDDHLASGHKLLSWKTEKDPIVNGTGMSYTLTLTLQKGDAPSFTRRLAYRVVTHPRQCITKEDSIP